MNQADFRKYFLRLLIGLTLLLIIFVIIDIEEFFNILTQVDISLIVLAIFVHILATGITAWRIAFLTERNDKFSVIFMSNLSGMLLGDVTPGRMGYFFTPVIINKQDPSISTSGVLSVIFFGQSFDFILRGFLLIAAFLIIFATLGVIENLIIYMVISLLILVAASITLLLMAFNKIPEFLRNIIQKIPVLAQFYKHYFDYMESHDQSNLKTVPTMVITIIGWLMTSLRWMLVGLSLNLTIDISWYLFLFPALTVASFIPLTSAGLGFVEGGFVLIFHLLGSSTAAALIFTLTDRCVSFIGNLLGFPYLYSSFLAEKQR